VRFSAIFAPPSSQKTGRRDAGAPRIEPRALRFELL
jgi:hypothetical protein